MGSSGNQVRATWGGPASRLADGTSIDPGSEHDVPAAEAKADDRWHPVKQAKRTPNPSEPDTEIKE